LNYQIFGNNFNESKFYSGRNYEQIEVRMLAITRCRSFFVPVLLSKNMETEIYRTIIFPVILYGCETWSLTLREECRLRVLESRVLKKIFGPKRGEVTEEWRKLHNEGLNDLYSSPNII